MRLVSVYETRKIKDDGSVSFEPVTDMHFATAQVGWAVGGRKLLRTSDGGRTWVNQFWNRQDCPHLYPRRVFAVSARTCWVVATLSPTSMRCCFTRDSGKTWKGKEFKPEIHPNDLFFVDSKRGWLVSDNGKYPASGEGRIHVTDNGGETWIATETLFDGRPDRVHFYNTRKGWLTEHNLNGDQTRTYTRLHTSGDGGYSWQKVARFGRALFDVHAVDDQRILVVGESGFIARSLDGGKSWKRLDSSIRRADFNSIQFYDDRLGLALGDFNTLLLTTDGGDNWEKVKVPYDGGNFIGAHFTSSRSGIIASDHGLHSFELDL